MKTKIDFLVAIIICCYLIAFCVININAQQKSESLSESNDAKLEESFKPENYRNWKKISLEEFSFYLPKDFELKKKRGDDTSFFGYKNDTIDLTIYSGSRLPDRGLFEEKLATYKEELLYVNNIFTNLWSYEYELANYHYKYIEVARYYTDKKANGNGLVISFNSKEDKSKELSKNIFLSVQRVSKINRRNRIEKTTVFNKLKID